MPGIDLTNFDPSAMIERLKGYTPPVERGRLFFDGRALTFQRLPSPDEERVRPFLLSEPSDGWMSYAAYTDHTTLLLTDEAAQRALEEAGRWEKAGLRWNYALKARLLPMTGLAIYAIFYHVGGIELGNGLTPWLWGAFAGLAMNELAAPVFVGAAIAHTFVIKASYFKLIWQGGLSFTATTALVLALTRQTRLNLYEGWREREKLQQSYSEAWRALGAHLEERLQNAIQGGSAAVERLHTEMEPLLQVSENLQHLYGVDFEDFGRYVTTVVRRIAHVHEVASKVEAGRLDEISAPTLLAAYDTFNRDMQLDEDAVPKTLYERHHLLHQYTCLKISGLSRGFSRDEALQKKAELDRLGVSQGTAFERLTAFLQADMELSRLETLAKDHLQEKSLADLRRRADALIVEIAKLRKTHILGVDPSQQRAKSTWQLIQSADQTRLRLELAKVHLENLQRELAHRRLDEPEMTKLSGQLQTLQQEWDEAFEATFHTLHTTYFPVQWRELEEAHMLAHYHLPLGAAVVANGWQGVEDQVKALKEGTLKLRTFVRWVDQRAGSCGARSLELQMIVDAYDYLVAHRPGDA